MGRDPRGRTRRRLLVAVVLTLVPGAALAAFGWRALGERERGLGIQYTATTVLVRDRIAAELTRLETGLLAGFTETGPASDSPASLQRWLTGVAGQPWLADPFVLAPGAGVVTSEAIAGWSPASAPLPARLEAVLRDAEASEYEGRDLDGALRQYGRALELADSERARALAHMRLGRILFKLKRWSEGIGHYRSVVESPAAVDPHGVPYAVGALRQIADGYDALGRPGDRDRAGGLLRDFVLEHPWDVDAGYVHYLARVRQDGAADRAVVDRIEARMRAAATTAWLRREVGPQIPAGLESAATADTAPRRLIATRGDRVAIIGFRPLSASTESVQQVLGYEIRPEYVATTILAAVLGTVDLGGDVAVVVPAADGVAPRSAAAGDLEAEPLAMSPLGAVLPGWQVALVDRDGRSLAERGSRERWTYGLLIGGLIVVLAAGVVFTMRASAREAELARLRTEFVSNVSHELKTPLALIRMFGETLESGLVADQGQRREFSGIIRRESERLTHLINNVLDAGKIDAGTKQYSFTASDVARLVREALDAYRPFFERLGFTIEAAIPDEPCVLAVDRDALVQALVNLFHNAIKYSGERKAVRVTLDARPDAVRVSVADRGIGIPRAEIPRIFDKYYRIARGGTAEAAGSGLGLAIVRHALEAHGGRVEVESTVGEGSTFTLVIPHG